jgi:hypothetical protein
MDCTRFNPSGNRSYSMVFSGTETRKSNINVILMDYLTSWAINDIDNNTFIGTEAMVIQGVVAGI